ncbi:response regulator [Paenibacillus athensensis]|uniref:histidine kinase n=1 Tax=Paenibacillus athensensis TaxID=1967502 RepID=A0A4Y8Q170_9BACL|nr:ATP-binding protein [Paenibacillus athensensis]MCD1261150.1 response regulator [Paenibacillus athensensis]
MKKLWVGLLAAAAVILGFVGWLRLAEWNEGPPLAFEYRWGDSPAAGDDYAWLHGSPGTDWLHAADGPELSVKNGRALWLQFHVPERLACSDDCAFYAYGLMQNYEAFVDGKRVFQNTDGAGMKFPRYGLNMFGLGPDPAGKTLHIRLTSDGRFIGLSGPVLIDSRFQIVNQLWKRDMVQRLPFITAFMLLAVYFILLYWRRPRDRHLPYLALFLVLVSACYVNNLYIRVFIYDNPYFWNQCLAACTSLAPIALCLFMERLAASHRRFFRWLAMLQAVVAVCFVGFQPYDKLWAVDGFNGLQIATIVFTGYVLLRLALRDRELRLAAAGFGIFLALSLYDFVQVMVRPGTYYVSQYGLLLFVLCLFYLQLRRAERDHRHLQLYSKELNHYAQKLVLQNQELERMARVKDQLLANTSHELRTPLHAMLGLAQALVDGSDGSDGAMSHTMRDDLRLMMSSGERLSRLIDDLLDFSVLKRAEIVLKREKVDLALISENVIGSLRPLLQGGAVTLSNHARTPIYVEADAARLEQILYNLLGNAIKFTREGAIDLHAAICGPVAEIRVTDTGDGIPEDRRELIFEPFEQGPAQESGVLQRGVGLGLAITRQLVELHGGTLRVESAQEQGACFIVTLPLAQLAQEESEDFVSAELAAAKPLWSALPEVAAAADPEALVPELQDNGTARILVVEDDPVNVRVLLRYLSAQGWGVQVCRTGTEALDKLRESLFDVILLDVMLPDMSGYEICRAVRCDYESQELPVIMLTAKQTAGDIAQGFAAGASDYVTKPFSKQELLARIEARLQLSVAAKTKSKITKAEKVILTYYYNYPELGRREMTELLNREKEFPITEKTMANHINHILKKIPATSMAEAARIAKKKHWL